MPITLLHLGLLAPINHFTKYKVSNAAFFFTSLMIDMNSIAYFLFGVGMYEHQFSHTFIGTNFSALIIWFVDYHNMKWFLGAVIAANTHWILDGLVHPEIKILLFTNNPLYLGGNGMLIVSLLLLPLLIWFIVQSVLRKAWQVEKLLEDSGSLNSKP